MLGKTSFKAPALSLVPTGKRKLKTSEQNIKWIWSNLEMDRIRIKYNQ